MSDPANASSAYQQLLTELRETSVLSSVAALLSWDQEVMMPDGATELRAEQGSMLGQLVHDRWTSNRFGDLLQASEEDTNLRDDTGAQANLREVRRSRDQAVKIPTSLIREFAEITPRSMQAWRDARSRSDFSTFAPWLTRIIELSRQRSECLAGPDTTDPYDPLLDEYEPGALTADIVEVFRDLREQLTPLIRDVAAAPNAPDDRINHIRIPIASQTAFNSRVAAEVGFDFDAGRLDTSTHPFCQGVGPGDTRITTRYREEGFFDALSSTLHEAGHALYEQGLPKAKYPGQPLSDSVSLGIHESQSRMWENFVGRSRSFWSWALPKARRSFAPALDDVELDEVYAAMNIVQPSLIRVESDEATYNLHIMLRFDIERAMLSGDLPIEDVPGIWNERMKQDLQLDVPDDAHGCLQDVHWSMGAVGYFPTYTLGNLYAAQFWSTLTSELGNLDAAIESGEFSGLLGWLRENIHRHGRLYTAPKLCEKVTGRPLEAAPFMDYLNGKVRAVYGI